MAMKKKAPAKKKAPIDYPEGASNRSKKVASKRMEAQARFSRNPQPSRGNTAAGNRLSEYERQNRAMVYQDEGGNFWSTGLQNKADREFAASQAERLKAASQQMKQGVTISGGYAKDYSSQINKLRRAKSAKFKADQAVKKSGGSLSRNARGKTTKRNAK
jgi:hypothetical protein